jgi:hypothetical protein
MEMASKLKECREKAALWDAYQAELKAEVTRQEKIRMAREKHAIKIINQQTKVARLQTNVERLKGKTKEAENKLMQAEMELEALMDEVIA